MSIFNAELS